MAKLVIFVEEKKVLEAPDYFFKGLASALKKLEALGLAFGLDDVMERPPPAQPLRIRLLFEVQKQP